jgi:hypothetical protein
MIAGGIGITPFHGADGAACPRAGQRFELHYAARTKSLGAYMDRLTGALSVTGCICYLDDQGQALDLKALLAGAAAGHASLRLRAKADAELGSVHRRKRWAGPTARFTHEEFLAPPVGKPFDGGTGRFGQDGSPCRATSRSWRRSRPPGVDAPYLCRGGACGQCETDIVRCDGPVLEHNDHWLTPDQKAAGRKIMPCVSRFHGRALVLDR